MIVVNDLVKNYGDFCAVNHISFTVPEGKDIWFSRAQRRGKNDHNQDADDGARADQRLDSSKRARSDARAKAGAALVWIVFQDPASTTS